MFKIFAYLRFVGICVNTNPEKFNFLEKGDSGGGGGGGSTGKGDPDVECLWFRTIKLV